MKAYIRGLAYALPEQIEENEKNRLTKKTGILRRHIAAEGELASDLAVQAAEKLFAKGLDRSKVDFLLFCTESPDYILPPTACLLQNRLGLSKHIGAFDYNLGCSGFVYGLGIAKGFIESGQAKNVLLITAETYSKHIHPQDHSTAPLFGDGASAVWIEGLESKTFGIRALHYGTDGSGAENLIVPVGGMRNPYGVDKKETTDQYNNIRDNYHLQMVGSAISEFSLEVVPETLQKVLSEAGLAKADVDYYVFHQANNFMLKYLQQKCDLLDVPYWNDVAEYGNTVSSSIPIALEDMLKANADKILQNVVIMGFGVGLSWAGGVIDLTKVKYL
ncbi:3-oxoacyl-ACP synthase III family protein [Selenomonas ruminantium]|uniref:3-oxoacyl-ACP synthase III family protein n=1 Tax=Selenomonas ruminantium TaxID=971 RepID=UPI0004799B54|nr:ketoacyl-ACP synthase III [Selenomonas ruminantium]